MDVLGTTEHDGQGRRVLQTSLQGVLRGHAGRPLSPTIFNVVVYAVILHWVTVVTPTEAGTGGLGLAISDLVEYFYSNNNLVASTQSERLHKEFDVFTGLLYRVGLRTNTENTVGMVCQPFHAPWGVLEEAYVQRVTGKGPTFQERQRRQVEFP